MPHSKQVHSENTGRRRDDARLKHADVLYRVSLCRIRFENLPQIIVRACVRYGQILEKAIGENQLLERYVLRLRSNVENDDGAQERRGHRRTRKSAAVYGTCHHLVLRVLEALNTTRRERAVDDGHALVRVLIRNGKLVRGRDPAGFRCITPTDSLQRFLKRHEVAHSQRVRQEVLASSVERNEKSPLVCVCGRWLHVLRCNGAHVSQQVSHHHKLLQHADEPTEAVREVLHSASGSGDDSVQVPGRRDAGTTRA